MDIQLIINTQVDVIAIWEAQQIEDAEQLFQHKPAVVSEMISGTYLIILSEKDDFDGIERAIEDGVGEVVGGDVDRIESWNEDGTPCIWENPNKHEKRKHTIAKYTEKLKQGKFWNEQTEEFDERAYTETEALDVQVNHVAGWSKRQL